MATIKKKIVTAYIYDVIERKEGTIITHSQVRSGALLRSKVQKDALKQSNGINKEYDLIFNSPEYQVREMSKEAFINYSKEVQS